MLKQILIEGVFFLANDIDLELLLAEQSDDEAYEFIEILDFLLIRIYAIKVSNLCVELSNKELSNRINSMQIDCFLSFIVAGMNCFSVFLHEFLEFFNKDKTNIVQTVLQENLPYNVTKLQMISYIIDCILCLL